MKCKYTQVMLDSWHSYLRSTRNCRTDTTFKDFSRSFNMANTVFRNVTYSRQDKEATIRKENLK